MTFNQDEIAKLDRLLTYLYDNRGEKVNHNAAAEALEVEKEEYKFINNILLDFSDQPENKLGNRQKAGKIDSLVLSIDNGYKAKRFIDNGGFKGYFDRQTEQMEKSTTNINVSGNGNIITNHSDFENSPLINIPTIQPERKAQKKIETSLSTIIAEKVASATRTPSTFASEENFQTLPRFFSVFT